MTEETRNGLSASLSHPRDSAELPAEPNAARADTSPARRILVVDDEAEIRFFMRMLMQISGFEVSTAEDGFDAIEKVKSENPELIILDITMERMDGLQVLELLRADESTADVPIIMLSALDSGHYVEKGLSVGANCYMTKPFDPVALVAKVRELLDERAVAPA